MEYYNQFCHLLGHFTFWISLSLRLKTKRLSFGLTPMLSLTNHSHASSLTSSAIHRRLRRKGGGALCAGNAVAILVFGPVMP